MGFIQFFDSFFIKIAVFLKWWNPERDAGFPYWRKTFISENLRIFGKWSFGIIITGLFINFSLWALLHWTFSYWTVPAWGLAPWIVVRFKEELFP